MSRSIPITTNPAKRFFQWSGSKGAVTYYDKEKAENITVPLPFNFIVLDELSTITGWNEKDGGYWSNEVRNITTDEITVRSKQGVEQVGTYANLGDIKAKGAKYAKSIYIAYAVDGNLSICNFKASGAALTAWIEFSNLVGRLDQQSAMVSLVGSEDATKGATKYKVPVFELIEANPEDLDAAFDLDTELQAYLNEYLNKPKDEPSIESEQELEIEDIDTDAPINLDDIPFD